MERVLDARVLPGSDPERVEHGLGVQDARLPLLGRCRREQVADERCRVLVERPLRLASSVALDAPAGRIRRLPRDSRELERAAVDPHPVAVAVVEERGPVGQDRVEVHATRGAVLEGVDRPACAGDPLELGMVGRIAGDRFQAGLARVGVVERAEPRFDPAVRRMAVRVLEAWEDRAAFQLEHVRLPADVCRRLRRRADPRDAPVADGDRLGDRQRRVRAEDTSPR